MPGRIPEVLELFPLWTDESTKPQWQDLFAATRRIDRQEETGEPVGLLTDDLELGFGELAGLIPQDLPAPFK